MPRWTTKRPGRSELESVLNRVVSISALAEHYQVSFATAKKWILDYGLESALADELRGATLRKIIEDAPKIARRASIDRDLETALRDLGDRKLLARAIVDEFSFGYRHKKNGRKKRHTLVLEVMMYDPPPVRQVAELMRVKYRRHLRKARDGTPVPYWETRAEGYRAYAILRLVRPYLVGQKAFQADVVLKTGPFPDEPTDVGMREYKKRIFEENKLV